VRIFIGCVLACALILTAHAAAQSLVTEVAYATIRGTALTSSNSALPKATVRLRDARAGHILDTQVTDEHGSFAFRMIDPGSYIIEVVAPEQGVILAASGVINIGPGDVITAAVKLPVNLPLAGMLGGSTPTATAIAAQAAASGVLAAQVVGAPTCVPLE
jgi:hypothetical protein